MTNPVKKDKPHIAMYIGSLQKGGAERVMVNLADYFFEQGYKVSLVTTYLAPEEYEVKHAAWKVVPAGHDGAVLVADTEEGPAWVDPEGNEPGGIRRYFSALLRSEQEGRVKNLKKRSDKLTAIWKELKPDLVLSFIGKNNIMALSTATREDIKVVVSVRADPHMEYDTMTLKSGMLATFGKAAGVVVQTEDAKKFFPPHIRKKCTILPNAINPAFLRKRYVGDREGSIVMVGRLDENKNHAMVMEVFAEVVKEGYKNLVFKIYGDGPDRLKLQRKAIALGIDKNVVFVGMVSNVAEHIEKADLFVLASRQEGSPNALIEAMALGLPCISTDCPCGGPRDLIKDGENGILIPVDDKAALKAAMLRILGDKDFAEKIGINATKVQEKYSPEASYRKWEEYFQGILKG
ncbi:glycosyltransferase [Butyrivibrio sp. DSM 10294]|uniref:glycosyltransferase n=1 Tax=Butyrivibrio sp. DSM 10294 TaxID=2972457 RepID=UPI00234E8335|nr:glycosyltransferase [Butyrivibrio sp. DSM 10294]MDC7292975.1 glycosyltransferase [Butyrivibrio sp. DSM 10294]